MATPSGRKVTQAERERKKDVNSGQLVLCSAQKPIRPKICVSP